MRGTTTALAAKKNTAEPVVPQKTLRSSNIELLRILAMIGIIISHLTFSSPHALQVISAGTFHTYFLVVIQALGQIGVFIFFLISGYFMVRKDFSPAGIKKVLYITWFYSSALFVLALLIGAFNLNAFFNLDPSHSVLSVSNALRNIMPITQDNYWFVDAYIVVLLLSPALNKIIGGMTKQRLFLALAIIGAVFYGLSFVSRLRHWGLQFDIYGNLLLYGLVYAIGGYLQLHPPKLKTWQLFALLGGSIALYLIWRYHLVYVTHTINVANQDTDFPPFLIAIFVFALFTRLKMGYKKWINTIAASTFAVYIIHTNMNVWPFLWKTFDVYSVFNSKLVYLYPFVIATFVLLVCVGIELLRQRASLSLGRTLLTLRGKVSHASTN